MAKLRNPVSSRFMQRASPSGESVQVLRSLQPKAQPPKEKVRKKWNQRPTSGEQRVTGSESPEKSKGGKKRA